METLIDQDIEIHPLIEKRWSPRAFSDRPIEAEALLQLFEAARWAASSYNEQPWRIALNKFVFSNRWGQPFASPKNFGRS